MFKKINSKEVLILFGQILLALLLVQILKYSWHLIFPALAVMIGCLITYFYWQYKKFQKAYNNALAQINNDVFTMFNLETKALSADGPLGHFLIQSSHLKTEDTRCEIYISESSNKFVWERKAIKVHFDRRNVNEITVSITDCPRQETWLNGKKFFPVAVPNDKTKKRKIKKSL